MLFLGSHGFVSIWSDSYRVRCIKLDVGKVCAKLDHVGDCR